MSGADTLVRRHHVWLEPDDFAFTVLVWVDLRERWAAGLLARNFLRLALWSAVEYMKNHRCERDEAFAICLNAIHKGLESYTREKFDDGHKLITFLANRMRWDLKRNIPAASDTYHIPVHTRSLAMRLFFGLRKFGMKEPLSGDDIQKLAHHYNVKRAYITCALLARKSFEKSAAELDRDWNWRAYASLEDGEEDPKELDDYGTGLLACDMDLPDWEADEPVEVEPVSEFPSPEDFANGSTVKQQVSRMLGTLPPREERVLRLRYGFDGEALTREEVGALFNVTPARIGQIEAKALRLLKHPAHYLQFFGRRAHAEFTFGDNWMENRDMFEVNYGPVPGQLSQY